MNVRSRPLLIRLVMSSLVSVWLTEWTTKSPLVASRSAMAGRTGTRCRSTTAWSPSILPTIRTADPPGETRPSCGGDVIGSSTLSNAGTVVPPSEIVSPLRPATVCATNAW